MKKIVLIIFSLIWSYGIIAQKPFEGEITYKLTVPGEKENMGAIVALFAPNKIKLKYNISSQFGDDIIITLLDSEKVYLLTSNYKIYKQKFLQEKDAPSINNDRKTILGYNTTCFQRSSNNLNGLIGTLFLLGNNFKLYCADSLFYNIPSKFIGNEDLFIVQNNKIVVGATMIPQILYKDDTFEKKYQINIDAISIKPMPIDEKEFAIPADFVDAKTLDEKALTDRIRIQKNIGNPSSDDNKDPKNNQ